MFFTLFRYWMWGVVSPNGVVHKLLVRLFTLKTAQKLKFPKLVFLIL